MTQTADIPRVTETCGMLDSASLIAADSLAAVSGVGHAGIIYAQVVVIQLGLFCVNNTAIIQLI
jgi:hypothetical protein